MVASEVLVDNGDKLVRVFRDPEAGLLAVIAVDAPRLGPGIGSVWRRVHESLDDAVSETLRLSGVMALRSGSAQLPLGGGGAVIVDDGASASTAVIDAFADAVDSLGGRYVAAAGGGLTRADLSRISQRTRWTAGWSAEAGTTIDLTPPTARTVFGALRSAATLRWGPSGLAGRSVGVLGVGDVGGRVAELAADAGAAVIVADVSAESARRLAERIQGMAVSPQALLGMDLDALAPCAPSAMLCRELAAKLHVDVICGTASDLYADDAIADELARRGILYVPDFLADAGGLAQVGGAHLGWSQTRIDDHIDRSIDRIALVLEEAARRSTTPLRIARETIGQALRADRARVGA